MPDDQAPSMTADELQSAFDKTPAAKVTAEYMRAHIRSVSYQRLTGTRATFTLCNITLDNGWSVRGESACVNPENFDEEIGKSLAYKDAFGKLWPLFGFVLCEKQFDAVLNAAKLCHAANRAICEAQGDHSQVDWEDAPAWQRESAVNGVRFLIANPDAGDSAQHDNWMREKIADGWVYGETKDPETKKHPCLVPFDQLPPMQQLKDRMFRAVAMQALAL